MKPRTILPEAYFKPSDVSVPPQNTARCWDDATDLYTFAV